MSAQTATRRPAESGSHYDGSPTERLALGTFVKLLRAAHWASERAGRHRAAAGLTETQWGVLEALHHRGPLIQTAVAGKLLSSPSNLTLVLDNLERDGLVVRRPHESDRRCRVAALTPKGRRLVKRVLPRHVAGIVEILQVLDESEQRELGALCRKLGKAAERLERGDEAG